MTNAQDLSLSVINSSALPSGVVMEDAKASAREEYPILRLGGDLATLFSRLDNGDEKQKKLAATLREAGKTREDNTLYAGEHVEGKLIGTVPMFSMDFKENWEERLVDGKKVWFNQHYLFETSTGIKFGVHDARASLWLLEKISTSMTNPSIKNPYVRIDYVGLIEGKERLEKEYNIKLTTGKEAHVCTIKTEKGTIMDTYAAGALNLTRDPRPNFGSEEKVDRFTQNERNFAKAQVIHGSVPAVEGHASTQLSM